MALEEMTKSPAGGTSDELECPLCASGAIETSVQCDEFQYGSGDSAVTLKVDLPVRRCATCDLEFVDHEGERLRHEAVCRHLEILTPAEVRGIRERRGMTRAAFAEATALGTATLARWETGAVVQNRAYDGYLRLLDKPANLEETRRHMTGGGTGVSPEASADGPRFRNLVVNERVLYKSEVFQLRRPAQF